MIISHKYKALYIVTPKTGSTSIRKALYPHFEVTSQTCVKLGIPHIEDHLTPRNSKKYFEQQNWDWDSYFKFTFVRNPWALHASRWNYMLKIFNGPKKCHQYKWYHKQVSEIINKYKNFENWTINATHKSSYYQYAEWTDDLDFVGNVESLQRGMDYVSKKIDMPMLEIPHVNKSSFKHYSTYYNDETKNIIAEAYSEDIERFKYTFELC